MPSSFDYATFLDACAKWQESAIENAPAPDPVLERVRQILQGIKIGNAHPSPSLDLIPLVRQVLLRRPQHETGRERIRVPQVTGWPQASQWRDGGFDVLDNGSWLSISAKKPRIQFLGPQEDLFDDTYSEKPARTESWIDADPAFRKLLKLPHYTGPGQREAVRALMQMPTGEALIANLPTGSGKSVLAQLPPLLAGPGFLTLAIVPTVALAIDQANRMAAFLESENHNGETPPLSYHAGLNETQRKEVRRAILDGRQRILFLSPEHAASSLRSVLLQAAQQGRISHVVVDEAHLVIGWGNGFRPAFQLLPALVRQLQRVSPHTPPRLVLASATLTAATIKALQQLFSSTRPARLISGVYLRPEPSYAFSYCTSSYERRQRVLEAVAKAPRPFILYVTRPDEAEQWLKELRQVGLARVAMFTGKTKAEDRERLLSRWRDNELDGMVATSAFGLGVDKSDVRTIIHATLPESLDRYYQEVGRSGRDGKSSASLVLYTEEDEQQSKRMAATKVVRERTAFERWALMMDEAQVDAEQSDVHWVNLERLPPHLMQDSEASSEWNVKTIILMARAGMVELVALTVARELSELSSVVQADSDAKFAAVRILKTDHRNEEAFREALMRGRAAVRLSSAEGFRSMHSVVQGKSEISQALRKTYAANSADAWVPVAEYCGGCAVHWGAARSTQRALTPVVPRLSQFEPRANYKKLKELWPMASSNLLLIAVPVHLNYDDAAQRIVLAIVEALSPHTLLLGAGLSHQWAESVLKDSTQSDQLLPFVEVHRKVESLSTQAGSDEVRLSVFAPNGGSIPVSLWASRAALEIVVAPESTPHPSHPTRRLVDTTMHIPGPEFLSTLHT